MKSSQTIFLYFGEILEGGRGEGREEIGLSSLMSSLMTENYGGNLYGNLRGKKWEPEFYNEMNSHLKAKTFSDIFS